MSQKKETIKLVLVSLVSIIVGFLAGREHLKYELRSTVNTALSDLRSSLKSGGDIQKDRASREKRVSDFSRKLLEDKKNRLQKRIEDLEADIKEAEDLKTKCKLSEKYLAKFKVLKSIFRKDGSGFREKNVFDLKFKNGLDKAIARIGFKTKLVTKGRSIPWIEDKFDYKIRGGIEPGETQEVTLAPNSFGDWGKVEPKDDMILYAKVYQVFGADDKVIHENVWSKQKSENLKALKIDLIDLENSLAQIDSTE